MEVGADPQNPDPNVFWCMECSGHTDYSETKESVSTEQGSYDAVTLKCKACDTEGEIPKQVRESVRLYAKCLIGLVIVFEAIAVVPEPKNVSNTKSPSLECFLISSSNRGKDFCVG